MNKVSNHPQWALDQKRPGTELRRIRGKYYFYECSSFYDKEKKKTRKKTGAYLGMVTEDRRLVPPRRRQVEIENETVEKGASSGKICVPEPRLGEVKEYGLSTFVSTHCEELTANLKFALPTAWNRVLAMAYCRLRNQSPLNTYRMISRTAIFHNHSAQRGCRHARLPIFSNHWARTARVYWTLCAGMPEVAAMSCLTGRTCCHPRQKWIFPE